MPRNKSAKGITKQNFGMDSELATSSNTEAARNLNANRNTVREPAPVQHAPGLGKVAGSKVRGATQTKGGAV